MRQSLKPALAALGLALSLGPALAQPACIEARAKVDEASALRYQARQDARIGDHDRVCDTLDEIGDRYNDARDAFEDCGAGVTAIELRGALRNLRLAKHVNRCD